MPAQMKYSEKSVVIMFEESVNTKLHSTYTHTHTAIIPLVLKHLTANASAISLLIWPATHLSRSSSFRKLNKKSSTPLLSGKNLHVFWCSNLLANKFLCTVCECIHTAALLDTVRLQSDICRENHLICGQKKDSV